MLLYAQLGAINYSEAVDHYRALKNRMLEEYGKAVGVMSDEFLQSVEEDIVNDVNAQPITEQEKWAEELFDWVGAEVAKKLDSALISEQRSNVKQSFQEESKASKKQAEETLAEFVEEVLSEDKIVEYIKNSLASRGVDSGFQIEDILNQIKGYQKKLILTRKDASAQAYINATKGYLREAIVYKAFAQLGNYLDGIKPVVLHTGSIKDDKGRDTIYDAYVNFFGDIEQGFNSIISESFDAEDAVGYGIQSKSWIAPWDQNNNFNYLTAKYGFSLGSKSGLLKRFLSEEGFESDVYSLYAWVRSALFLERNAIEAIGKHQVAWITGGSFMWTYEMIQNFRKKNYFLTFGTKTNKDNVRVFSSTVAWG